MENWIVPFKKNVHWQLKFFNMLRSLVILVGLFSASIVAAQNTASMARPNFEATALEEAPQIDGEVINDPVWAQLTPITDLVQTSPRYGAAVSEKTHIRVAYTDKTFYVAVVCFDQNPEKIVVSDSRRDADLNDEDSFLFIIDTYNDQQNGFLFGTNSSGMEYDAQIDREGQGNFNANRQQGGVVGGTNINWDASWTVKTQLGAFGWSAEFAIPLNSIRFTSGKSVTWGINFQRNIAKNTETAYWASLPLGFDIKRLSLAGKVNGLELKSPKNLKIIPYVLGQNARTQQGTVQTKTTGDVGMDVKYSLTPGLTLDLTYNTDFAQVEVDEQQVNLDRFNLFFPEKRAFFLENAGQFTVGSPGEVDLFFSRRIGIGDAGELVPIVGGARVSGKIGQTNVGLLSMFTQAVGEAIPETNYSVARINHDFAKSRSSFGGVFVGKSPLGTLGGDDNQVFALDGKLGIGKKAQITGFVSKSATPGITADDHAFQINGIYNWDGWNIRAGYTEVGEGFNPEVGFLLRSAFKKPDFLIFKQWRPENLGPILEVRPHISYRSYWNFDNQLISSFTHVDNHWVWPSGFEVHTGINFTQEGVLTPFSISGVTVDTNLYKHEELQLVVITNPNAKINLSNRTVIGGYYGGNRVVTSNTINARFGDKFNVALNLNYNQLELPNGDINAFVGGTRLSYSFTPRMFVQSLIQRNSLSDITSVNARFGWLQNANTGLFVVLNLIEDQSLELPKQTQFFTIKYTYQIDAL